MNSPLLTLVEGIAVRVNGTGTASPLLTLVEGIAARVNGTGTASEADGLALLRRLVNGPVIGFVVKATPTPLDDLVLDFLKAVLPAK